MRYGISAASLLVEDGRILLVHHYERGRYDFWVPPGGKLKGDESIFQCAQRETLEETALRVDPYGIAYVQEYVQPGYHFCKFFMACRGQSGEIGVRNRDADETFLVEARFLSRGDLADLTVHPEIIRNEFWRDLEDGFSVTKYLAGAHWRPIA